METLLMMAVILIASAIVVQAGILIAMYALSKRVAKNAEELMNEGRRLMVPLEPVTHNFGVISEDLEEISKAARAQFQRISVLMQDADQALRAQAKDVQSTVMSPIRRMSALGAGMCEAARVLMKGRSRTTFEEKQRPYPSAS